MKAGGAVVWCRRGVCGGVVYKVGEIIQVWVGRGGAFGGVVVRAEKMLGEIIQVGGG